MNSATVDLIYLDPPFNSKANYAAPIGSKAAGAAFKDTWTLDDLDVEWIDLIESKHPALHRVVMAAMTDSDKSYLVYMATRLLEMKRLLKPTGSIYLHCDPTMSHYLKLLMDAIFGHRNFRNEITWQRHSSLAKGSQHAPRTWGNTTDTLLFYAGAEAKLRPYRPMTESERLKQFPLVDATGQRYYDDSSHIWRTPNMGTRPNLCYEWKGFTNPHPSGWRLSKERLEEEFQKGNFVIKENGRLQRRKYERDYRGKQAGNLWTDISIPSGTERTGYPTQKPLDLLRRIIEASSNEGDVILDPFCGCATTCVAADKLDREWVGIDISEKAYELVNIRLRESQGAKYLKDGVKQTSFLEEVIHRTDIPQRTDLGKLPRYNCKENRVWLYGSQEGNCAHCNTHFEMRHLEVDHIIARSKGGTDHIDNLQMLCASCNRIKGNRGMEYLRQRLRLAA
ncbi:MAG: hypothetical protein F4Z37_12630 [Rhodothermaceae bacterium]|nr:hypothetical protein [Rhodothermaceae bacterium]MYJ55011.1 hypothetical protein [Rhodothermaceae bacterium]